MYIQRRGGGPLHAVMVDINLRLRSPDLRCARARAPPLEALLECGSGICNIVRGKTRSFLHTAAQRSQPHWHCFLLSPNQLLLCSSNFLFRPLLKYLHYLDSYRSSHKISTLHKQRSFRRRRNLNFIIAVVWSKITVRNKEKHVYLDMIYLYGY